ncbi:MAG: 5-bromo-4-chloroindolyl phosphate hydrolysis family protein [Spirochaetota bacterium]
MIIRFLLSLIAGTITFIYLKEMISGFLSFLIACLVYFLIYRLIKRITNKSKTPITKTVKNPDTDETIRRGFQKLKQIRNSTVMIKNNESAAKIKEICTTGFEILEHLRKYPEDLKKAKPFLNYYLVTTEKIVNRYTELCSKKEKSEEVEKAIENVEAVLYSISETYKKQLNNLLEDDLLDLSVEISVLEKTMKLEA